jgi:oligopeptide transport system permease protein
MIVAAKNANLLTGAAEVRGRSLWTNAWRRLAANRIAMSASVVLGLIVLLAIFGPLLSSYRFDAPDWNMILAPPGFANGHLFGTDNLGRDLFVRTLDGGRISLMVGVVTTLVSLVIGVTYGAVAGYFGGRIDSLMMRFVDVLYAMPFMFFVILLMVFFGRHLLLIFIAIGAINWLDMARIVRGQTLSLKRQAFIEAARASGVSTFNIIRRHIVPNLIGVVAVYATLTIPRAILVEAFLSFLGLGVQVPNTSWGALVSEGARQMQSAWWMLIFPAAFLAATLFCFNFIGDGLRDALDPSSSNR